MRPRVRIVATALPGANARGPGAPVESGPWAQPRRLKVVMSATVMARPEAIRIDPSFVTGDDRSQSEVTMRSGRARSPIHFSSTVETLVI